MAVVVGHIILISAQVSNAPRRAGARGADLRRVRRGAARRDVGRSVGARTCGRTTSRCSRSRQENEQLRTEVAQLRVGLQQERALAEQSRTLQQLLDLQMETPLKTTAAYVIAGGASPDFRTITIDKGTQRRTAARHGRHRAGRRRRPHHPADGARGQGSAAHRPRRRGRRGDRAVAGAGRRRRHRERRCASTTCPGTADIKVGDRVVTSGIDGIYPKGFRDWSDRIDRARRRRVQRRDHSSGRGVLVARSGARGVDAAVDRAERATGRRPFRR